MTPAELSALCRSHGPEVMQTLLDLMRHGSSDQCRLKAAQAIWDRGYGRSAAEAPMNDELATLSTAEKVKVLESALQAERDKLKADLRAELQ